MKKSNLMPSIVLGCICLVAALLLSVVNKFTAPIIAKRQSEAANSAFAQILPGATGQEEITLDATYPAIVKAGYKFDNGYVFQMEVTGKDSGFVIMVGIDLDGKITGTKVISNKETPSYAEKVFDDITAVDDTYNGQTLDTFSPYLVGGATLTSKAYSEAVKAALQSYVLASGGTVDTRTPEQIFQDDCNAALGTTGKTFTKWFATEIVTGVDAVYECADGRVYIIGENMVGVKAGTVTTAAASAADKAAALAADAVIVAGGAPTDVTSQLSGSEYDSLKSSFEDFATVKKAYKTASGNYVFELEANGYRTEAKNKPAEVISIKVSISSDGKIIDVVTVSHTESKGIGDKCATEEYYGQYKGASDGDIVISNGFYPSSNDYTADYIPENSTDIGAIGNATYTTVGYQSAVKLAFGAFALLTASN